MSQRQQARSQNLPRRMLYGFQRRYSSLDDFPGQGLVELVGLQEAAENLKALVDLLVHRLPFNCRCQKIEEHVVVGVCGGKTRQEIAQSARRQTVLVALQAEAPGFVVDDLVALRASFAPVLHHSLAGAADGFAQEDRDAHLPADAALYLVRPSLVAAQLPLAFIAGFAEPVLLVVDHLEAPAEHAFCLRSGHNARAARAQPGLHRYQVLHEPTA